MVNASALQKITEFIESENIQKMKKWSDRSRYENGNGDLLRYLRDVIKKIRAILIILSGVDVVEMLCGD